MGKCRYDLSEDCHKKDCLDCVLDKISAEIEQLPLYCAKFKCDDFAYHIDKEQVLQIIDKYRK